jgi:lipoate-protein ligase A
VVAPPLRLLDDAHRDDAVLDLAITHALLREVADGTAPATARIFHPAPTLAFGRLDASRAGFPAAAAAARDHGFRPLLRLAGGRAAAYDEASVLVELIAPAGPIVEGIEERFADLAGLIVDALAAVGIAAAVGELPGEYCPGRFSVHAGGIKLAGVAQRVIRGASLATASIAVGHGPRLRDVLVDVYAALDLAWDPATAGAADALAPVTPGAVAAALRSALAGRGAIAPGTLAPATVRHAHELSRQHLVPLAY